MLAVRQLSMNVLRCLALASLLVAVVVVVIVSRVRLGGESQPDQLANNLNRVSDAIQGEQGQPRIAGSREDGHPFASQEAVRVFGFVSKRGIAQSSGDVIVGEGQRQCSAAIGVGGYFEMEDCLAGLGSIQVKVGVSTTVHGPFLLAPGDNGPLHVDISQDSNPCGEIRLLALSPYCLQAPSPSSIRIVPLVGDEVVVVSAGSSVGELRALVTPGREYKVTIDDKAFRPWQRRCLAGSVISVDLVGSCGISVDVYEGALQIEDYALELGCISGLSGRQKIRSASRGSASSVSSMLVPGSYRITAMRGSVAVTQYVLGLAPGETRALAFDLGQLPRVDVSVRWPDGRPADKALVSCEALAGPNGNRDSISAIYTDLLGQCSLGVPAQGDYKVSVACGSNLLSRVVHLQAFDAQPVDFLISGQGGVIGTVYCTSGFDLPKGTRVWLGEEWGESIQEMGRRSRESVTVTRGRFHCKQVSSGTKTVYLLMEGWDEVCGIPIGQVDVADGVIAEQEFFVALGSFRVENPSGNVCGNAQLELRLEGCREKLTLLLEEALNGGIVLPCGKWQWSIADRTGARKRGASAIEVVEGQVAYGRVEEVFLGFSLRLLDQIGVPIRGVEFELLEEGERGDWKLPGLRMLTDGEGMASMCLLPRVYVLSLVADPSRRKLVDLRPGNVGVVEIRL